MAFERHLMMTRRRFGKISGAMGLAMAMNVHSTNLFAANPTETELHGLSAFGSLKYPSDFTQFDYVNPDAPKGGTFSFTPPNWAFNQNPQTFDTLNTFVLKGNAPPRMEMCFEALMAPALDEPDSLYGWVAKTVTISADRNIFRFKLRSEARFHDGSLLTAEDVAFSYGLLKEKGHPDIALTIRDLIEAVAIDATTVELRFNGKQSDRTILTAATFPILSKAWYANHEFTKSTLEAPLGSGPWKVGKVSAGRLIEYHRLEDYWGRNLPLMVGTQNFDRIRIEFFRERQAGFEAFKKGDLVWREEFTSKIWATEYNFPAIKDGRVVKRHFDDELSPSMQGWAVNTRRLRFSDPRTRQAIGLCFDFEWTNEALFYGAYTRSDSLFETSSFRAADRPDAAELVLLEPLRDQLPPEVFETAVLQPRSNGSGRDRNLLRKSVNLLDEAGWKRKGGVLVDAKGAPFTLEFLIRSPTFERILSKFVENLKAVGIRASIRLVDPSQFQSRLDSFDFDLVGIAFSLSPTPTGESMEQFFAAKYAKLKGSKNFSGVESPAVDALLSAVGKAKSRPELETAMRALDRVLRSSHYWIPNWYSANHRVAYWDIFGFKEPKPDYGFPVEQLWWFDEEKAKAIGKL